MKIERSIKRCEDKIQKLEENKDNLSIHGYWALGYWKGRLSALEDMCEDIKEGEVMTKQKEGKIFETIWDGKSRRVFSCCGTDFTKLTMWMIPNYCPNCGAKMDTKIIQAWRRQNNE